MSENRNNKQMLHEWVASGQTQSESQSQEQQKEHPNVSSTYDKNKVTISPDAFVADSMAKNSRQLLYAHIYNYMLNNGHYESAMTFLKEADVPVSADSPGFTLGKNSLLQTKVLMDSPNTFLLQWWNTMWHLNEFVEKQPLEYITNMRPFIDVIAPIMPIKQGPPQPPQPPRHTNYPQYNQRPKKDTNTFFAYPFQGPNSSTTQTPTTPLATSFNNRQSQYTPNGHPGSVRGPGPPGSNMTDPNGPAGYANSTQPNGYFANRSGVGAAPYQHHHQQQQQQQTSAKNTPDHEPDVSSIGAGPQYPGHPYSNMNSQSKKSSSAYQQYQQQYPAQHPYKQQYYGQPPQGYPSQQQYDTLGYPSQQILSKSSLETQFGSSRPNRQSGPAYENRGSIDNGRLAYEAQRQQRDMLNAGNNPQIDPYTYNNKTHGTQQNFYGKPMMNHGSPTHMHSPNKNYVSKSSPTGSQVSSTKEKKAMLAQVGRQKPMNRPSPVGNSGKLNHIPEEGFHDQPLVDGNGPVQGYNAKLDGNYYSHSADKNTNSANRFYQPPASSTLNNSDNNIGQRYATGNYVAAASPSTSVKSASSKNRAKKPGNVASTPVAEEEVGQEKPMYRFGNPEQQKFQLDQRQKAIKAQQQYQQLVLQQQLQKQAQAGGVDQKGVVSSISTPGNVNPDSVPRDSGAEFSAPPQSVHSGQPTAYQNFYYNTISGSASTENIDSATQQKMYSVTENTGRPGTQKTPANTGAGYGGELAEPHSVPVAAPGRVVKSKGAKKKTGTLLSPAVHEDEQPSEASVFEQTMADPFLMQDFHIDALSGSRPISVHDVVVPGARDIEGPHTGEDNMLDSAADLTKSVLHDTDLNDEDFYKSGVDLFQLDNVSGDFMNSTK